MHFRHAALAFVALLVACSPAKAPAPAAPPPAPVSPSVSSDAAPPSVDAAVPPEDAGAAALGPSCLSAELRAEGRVYAAEIADDGALGFCVKKGFLSDAPKACLRLGDGHFEAISDLWPGFRFVETSADETETASALEAHTAGTLTVCSARDHCATLRLRPPVRDAWDEVYGTMPAVAVRGTSRVLVARLSETYPRPNGPAKLEVFVDAFDVKRGAKVASARVARDQSPIHLLWLGKKALLETCELEGGPCSAFVIDPKSLASTKLPIELDRPSALGTGDASQLILRVGPDAFVLVDARGRAAIWVDAAGTVTRRVELGATTDAERNVPHAGMGNARALWVLQGGPSAGRVSRIDLDAGSITHFDAPACP